MRTLAAFFLLAVPPLPLQWKDAPPLPVGLVGHAGGLAGEAFVVAGGTWWPEGVKTWATRADRYGARSRQWLPAPALPSPLAYGASLGGPAGLEIFGGNDGHGNFRECLVLDPRGSNWRVNGRLPADRLMAGAAAAGGATYLFGGCGDPQGLTDCTAGVLVRNAAGKWSEAAAIPSGPVALTAAATAGGRIFLFGGAWIHPEKKLQNREEAWAFDPRTGKFQALAPLPVAARGIAAEALDDRRILLAGGYADSFLRSVLVYDIAADAYTQATPLPLAALGMKAARQGREVWLAGGEDRPKGRSDRVFHTAVPAGR